MRTLRSRSGDHTGLYSRGGALRWSWNGLLFNNFDETLGWLAINYGECVEFLEQPVFNFGSSIVLEKLDWI
jgi:hypothetical protein